MDAKELRQKSANELAQFIADARSRLHDATFSVATRQSGKVSELRTAKRDLSRALTVQNEQNAKTV
ncbi:50S ribosomal protein L29 [Patescibacteria group bacterium]|nr:50S ribosomal protein L29 [Patescibacteria group bacterium]